MLPSVDLTFVHISDIHFKNGLVGTQHDPDRELRDLFDVDLRAQASKFGSISGIIITGDVAFSGHPVEFQHAVSWITGVAGHLGCSLSNVMVIPGNHDVNRAALDKYGRRALKLQRRIRKGGDPSQTTARLGDVLSGGEGKILAAALKPYNQFAKTFKCEITPRQPFWERTFTLGDSSTLLVRGVTSTWLSGPDDDERIAKLLYGSAQYSLSKKDHTYQVVAAHHPPQNMIDSTDATRAFDSHCHLQLFGHKHDLWITSSKTCVRVAAGALQPDRRAQEALESALQRHSSLRGNCRK